MVWPKSVMTTAVLVCARVSETPVPAAPVHLPTYFFGMPSHGSSATTEPTQNTAQQTIQKIRFSQRIRWRRADMINLRERARCTVEEPGKLAINPLNLLYGGCDNDYGFFLGPSCFWLLKCSSTLITTM